MLGEPRSEVLDCGFECLLVLARRTEQGNQTKIARVAFRKHGGAQPIGLCFPQMAQFGERFGPVPKEAELAAVVSEDGRGVRERGRPASNPLRAVGHLLVPAKQGFR
jgi:hypothetical protein